MATNATVTRTRTIHPTLAAGSVAAVCVGVGLLVGVAFLAGAMETWSAWRDRSWPGLPRRLLLYLAAPLAVSLAAQQPDEDEGEENHEAQNAE